MSDADFTARVVAVTSRLRGDHPVAAEIGVANGRFSSALLSAHEGLTLYMVDNWKGEKEQPKAYRDTDDGHAKYSEAEQLAHMNAAIRDTEFAKDRRFVVRKNSVDAASMFRNYTFDLVFIDADHSYEGCKADIKSWKRTVKPCGWISGHDYGYEPLPGVKQAVDEAALENGWDVETGANYTWFARL